MTPDEHLARAKQLAAQAEQIYAESRVAVEDSTWRDLDTTIRLGQLHATLALQPALAGKSFTTSYETIDYGDGEPTHDRR